MFRLGSRRFPKKLLFYTFMEIVIPFLGGVFFFTFVFLMFQLVRLADYFINRGASLLVLAKLTVFVSSAFLPVVLPISFLVAVMIGFGRLSADSEIVAAKASGVGLPQLFVPVGVASVLAAAAVTYLSFFFIPWANYEFKRMVLKLGNTKVVSNLKEGTFTEGFFDLLVYADRVDAERNQMTGVFIFDERDQKSPSVIVAKQGSIIPQPVASELSSAVVLSLGDGAIHKVDLDRTLYEKVDFREYNLLLSVEEGSSGEVSYPKTRTQKELWQDMKRYEAAGDRSHWVEYSIEFWRRINISLAALVFGILGVGLGTVRMRSVKSNAVLVCVSVVVFYWVTSLGGAALAEKGWLTPLWAMSVANLILLPLAVRSFRQAMW